MSELVNNTELEKHGLTAAFLLQKFREQLQKDFEMSHVNLHFPQNDNYSYEDVHSAVSAELKKLIDKGDASLNHLLYRIDISELQFNRGLKEQEGRHPYDILAELIIKRVLQKVILKATHSR